MHPHQVHHLLSLILLALGGALRLDAVDQLQVWDDFDAYTAGTITASSGTTYAGGDGWGVGGGGGWQVDTTSGANALIASPSLVSSGGSHLETVGEFAVLRSMTPQAPTVTVPLWISFVLEAPGEAAVGGVQGPCHNTIEFNRSGAAVFSMNTDGTRVDGSQPVGQGSFASPLRWRLDQTDQGIGVSALQVDDNLHLVVIEVQTTQISLWMYPTATPSTVTALNPQMSIAYGSLASFDTIRLIASTDTIANPPKFGSLKIDDLKIGSSLIAVTNAGIPRVTGVSPTSGTNGGGDTVSVSGANFTSGTTVTIGGSPATVTVISSSSLQVITPPSATAGFTGAVDVVVANQVGQCLHAQGFTYVAPSTADPTLVIAPSIQGTPLAGSTLTADPGTWTPVPSGYAYQWQASPDGQAGDALPIANAVGSSYVVGTTTLGSFYRVQVTPTGSTKSAVSPFTQQPGHLLKASATSISTAAVGPKCGLSSGLAIVLGLAGWRIRWRRRAGCLRPAPVR